MRKTRRQLCGALICFLLLASPGLAAKKPVVKSSPKVAAKLTVNDINAELNRLNNMITRLKVRLAKSPKKQLKSDILDKIDLLQTKRTKLKAGIALLKKGLLKPISRQGITESSVSFEAGPEEQINSLPDIELKPRSRFRYEVGATYGFFAGMTSLLAEVRVPLRMIVGPTTVNLRLVTGLTQGRDDGRRFFPVNFDLIFNFPPGWFTGVENYLGCGLNSTALTTGLKSETLGGELCYGVESEGFGGTVFGELGFAIIRTGFTPSYKGMSVLLGYRLTLGN